MYTQKVKTTTSEPDALITSPLHDDTEQVPTKRRQEELNVSVQRIELSSLRLISTEASEIEITSELPDGESRLARAELDDDTQEMDTKTQREIEEVEEEATAPKLQTPEITGAEAPANKETSHGGNRATKEKVHKLQTKTKDTKQPTYKCQTKEKQQQRLR
jgi:hypothetical protein